MERATILSLHRIKLAKKVEKIEKNWSFTTTDEGFLEKLRISNPFWKSNGFSLIHMRGR
jgi:UDP-N-acetylglucosamine transferase subunit ALG13